MKETKHERRERQRNKRKQWKQGGKWYVHIQNAQLKRAKKVKETK